MRFFQTGTMSLRHSAMLEVNEFLVLDFVREHDRTSRPEIGRALGLSAASVSRIVARLLRAGLVVDSGRGASDGGRPVSVISFNRRAGAVMAVDLGPTTCRGVLADLAGDVILEDSRPTKSAGQPFSTLVSTIEALTAEAAREGVAVAALAVGVPAVVDPDTGMGQAGPSVDWEAFDVVAALAERVALPFQVENDVNLAALGHAWRGEARRVDDFFTLHLGIGVGGAVVANGGLVRGRHSVAGEVGYLLLDPTQSRHRLTGAVGGIEEAISAPALVNRARELDEAPGSRWPGDALAGVKLLFDLDAAREPVAVRVVDELVERVGLVLVAIAAIVDPSLVILDGPVGLALGPYIARLEALLERRLPRPPRVVVSGLGGDSTLLGAIASALQLARRESAPAALAGVLSLNEGAGVVP